MDIFIVLVYEGEEYKPFSHKLVRVDKIFSKEKDVIEYCLSKNPKDSFFFPYTYTSREVQ